MCSPTSSPQTRFYTIELPDGTGRAKTSTSPIPRPSLSPLEGMIVSSMKPNAGNSAEDSVLYTPVLVV